MESTLVSVITGAIIGWIGSLILRTDTQAGILLEIGVGALCGLISAYAVANSGYLLDVFLAAALGAMFFMGSLVIVRRRAP